MLSLLIRSSPQEARLALYDSLAAEFPGSQLLRRLPLSFTTGATFEALLDKFLRKGIRKGRFKIVRPSHAGVTPLYRIVRPLYSSPEKVTSLP